MKKGILLTIFTILSLGLFGQDLYSEIADSEDHSIFLDLLEYSELDSLLMNDGFVSVFAPNNAAFESKYNEDELDSLKLNAPGFLELLLLNHFVPDTVVVDFGSKHLPLSGSHFYLFVDGAGSVLLESLGTPFGEPNPYLSGTFLSPDLSTDLNNGRLFYLEQNIILPNCQSPDEMDLSYLGALVDVLIQSSWIDTLAASTAPLTFLSPATNEIYDYIEQNGGYSNTTFVDSFIRRHIINEYLPLQDIDGGVIVKNLLDEGLFFSKQNGQYFLNEANEIRNFYDFKKSAVLSIDSFLIKPNVSSIDNKDLDDLMVFPNPASEFITINNTASSKRATLNIFSIDGQFVYQEELIGAGSKVDIGHLKPGLYVLAYRSDSNLKRIMLSVL